MAVADGVRPAPASSVGDAPQRLLRAGLLTAMTDGLFATVLTIAIYNSTFTRLWQGVASTLLGPGAFTGAAWTTLLGLAMHVSVAFGWSAVFLFLFQRVQWIRRAVFAPNGVLKVAAVYGPCVWLVMSLIVIPLLVQRPPTITNRWWIQLAGHFPFVGLPIVMSIAWPRLWR